MTHKDLTLVESQRMVKASGLKPDLFDELANRTFAREINSALPRWASYLMLTFGWKWPMILSGVSVWQDDFRLNRQIIMVDTPRSAFKFDGSVNNQKLMGAACVN